MTVLFSHTGLDENEQKKQAVVRELVETEANYIQHLMVIVEVSDYRFSIPSRWLYIEHLC